MTRSPSSKSLDDLKKQMREEFRKRYVRGHGPSWAGAEPQEAEAWIEADIEDLEGFLEVYADKIAQETYEAVLPEKAKLAPYRTDAGMKMYVGGFNTCLSQTVAAFTTFIKGSV